MLGGGCRWVPGSRHPLRGRLPQLQHSPQLGPGSALEAGPRLPPGTDGAAAAGRWPVAAAGGGGGGGGVSGPAETEGDLAPPSVPVDGVVLIIHM